MKTSLKRIKKEDGKELDLYELSHAAKNIEKPAAIIYEPYFIDNLDYCCQLAIKFNKKIRIATKSIRCPYLLKKASKKEGVIGLMSHDPWETLELAKQGFKDIILAYPIHSEKALKAIEKCYELGTQVVIMGDDEDCIQSYLKWWSHSSKLKICLDIDVSIRTKALGKTLHLGVRRSPTHGAQGFYDLVKTIDLQHQKFEISGVMTYDAHIAGLTDIDPKSKTKTIGLSLFKKYAEKRLNKTRKDIKEHFGEARPSFIWNGGGTGSLDLSLRDPHINEITIGSGLLQPHLFDKYANSWGKPALFIAIEVTRKPDKNIVTCHGGGFIASGSLGADRKPILAHPLHLKEISAEGFGEVQTPFYDFQKTLIKGDSVLLRPAKSGEFLQACRRIFVYKNKTFKKIKCLS